MAETPGGEPEPDFLGVLVDFAHELRAAGLVIGSGDVLTYARALCPLNPGDIEDVYWAGRTTMVTRRDDIATYDATFRRFFFDEPQGALEQLKLATPHSTRAASAALEVPESEPGNEEEQGDRTMLGLRASDAAVLRSKSFAACTPQELAALRRIMARLRLTPPRRRTRRTLPARTGHTPDLRRTVRDSLRMHGDPAPLRWRRRRLRLRPLILILDVSGSMADYSRSLLQFAYSARRAAVRVEVFCFGTRLTRITRELSRRRPDDALAHAAESVLDWDGGTRIGDSLQTFIKDYARRGIARGGIVVVCSDGLDRGDPAVLAASMERLALLCHRLVWLNPLHRPLPRGARVQPTSMGMMVAAPHIDLLLSGQDLRGLEELALLLPRLG